MLQAGRHLSSETLEALKDTEGKLIKDAIDHGIELVTEDIIEKVKFLSAGTGARLLINCTISVEVIPKWLFLSKLWTYSLTFGAYTRPQLTYCLNPMQILGGHFFIFLLKCFKLAMVIFETNTFLANRATRQQSIA